MENTKPVLQTLRHHARLRHNRLSGEQCWHLCQWHMHSDGYSAKPTSHQHHHFLNGRSWRGHKAGQKICMALMAKANGIKCVFVNGVRHHGATAPVNYTHLRAHETDS